ncbi:hypothetical protein IW261DRAFT_1559708 [Armillaria novae-zelandiae]|uniref:BTB domain-containing protein n=1 Tax=Armillaria novae-zelandiae TaxID=153914 RepID=A0AA39PL40_9AGAR|nr:hypothetical protein IW261DRAFT_1559708 [Armillaria novae-zelandiae]
MHRRPFPVEKLSQDVNPGIPRRPGSLCARSKDFYWDISIFLVSPDFHAMRLFTEEAGRIRSKMYYSVCQPINSSAKSETFRTMFTLPATGISKVDFERLLKFMYPLNGLAPREISHEEWISILKLSTMWEMTEIRNTAISDFLERQLKIDATERISLGQEYDVPALVTSGIVSLANQRGGLSEEQMTALGWKMALRIQNIRVKLLEKTMTSLFSESAVRTVARDVFLGERSFSEPVKEVEGFETTGMTPVRRKSKIFGCA